MENRAHALAAGCFVLILGLGVFLAAIWLEGRHNEMREYLLVSQRSVTGLNPQAQVRYRGIRAGKVLDIDLDPRDPRWILVRISLDADMPVTQGTTARLNAQGITGLSYVMLEDDGSDPRPLTAGAGELPRIALQSSSIDALTEAAGRIGKALDERTIADFKRLLTNLASASDGLKTLPAILASVRETLSESNLTRLQKILSNLERTSGEVAPMAVELRALVVSLTQLSQRFERISLDAGGQVTSESLPRLNGLLNELQKNSRQLNRLLETLEQTPESVIFGRTQTLPGPGEAGYGGPSP